MPSSCTGGSVLSAWLCPSNRVSRMCLIAFRYQQHPTHALILAANRDEFYARPTAPAQFWDDAPAVLAGRDQQAGGTWMGVTRTGRWAALTNVRALDVQAPKPDAASRGHLVSEYLTGTAAPRTYLASIADAEDAYNGFNLLVGTPDACWYASNHGVAPQSVSPGTHGLSNHVLDTPWPKVQRTTRRLDETLSASNGSAPDADVLLDLLDDRTPAPDEALPDTGVGLEAERMLSPPFIESPDYGTRASTVLLIGHDGAIRFIERTFRKGTPTRTRAFAFDAAPAPTGASRNRNA